MKHLLVDISSHGYGHVAQTAPVVNALAQAMPELRVTVRSAAPLALLRQRFHCAFHHVPLAIDFGMQMIDAVRVDVPRSLDAYREYHAGWESKVGRAAQEMSALHPDLLLANVPYLSLAAAHAADIPAVAMCCLNWADIYRHYAPDDAESQAIQAQMLAAYNSAQRFFKIGPTMPMRGLHNALEVAPIAQIGTDRRQQIAQRCCVSEGERLVLVAMGGIEYRLPMEKWPHLPGVRWLIPQAWNIQRADMLPFESLGMSFGDVLASCDAVLSKPGYGTFAEAACAGVPLLYVSRGEWPEQPYLVGWLRQNGVCREVTDAQLQSGDLAEALQCLWAHPGVDRPLASGAEVVAAYLAEQLKP